MEGVALVARVAEVHRWQVVEVAQVVGGAEVARVAGVAQIALVAGVERVALVVW